MPDLAALPWPCLAAYALAWAGLRIMDRRTGEFW